VIRIKSFSGKDSGLKKISFYFSLKPFYNNAGVLKQITGETSSFKPEEELWIICGKKLKRD
jgi:hypothetical protein